MTISPPSRLLVVAVFLAGGRTASAQRTDPSLLTAIRAIRAIDNHAHPPALVAAGQKDDDFDALPCDPLEPTNPTISGRPENPRYIAAWKALYGYKYNDADSAHVRDMLATKQRMRTARGDAYPDWVLDQLGIETLLANRIAMGRGQRVPRFRWVPFADALLFPLDNRELAASTPDRKIFFAKEEALLKRYLKDLNIAKLPGSLDAYLSQVVTATIDRQKRNGAVAVKFEAAYLRSLNFTRGDRKAADAAYARYAAGGVPTATEYTALQDVVFHHIAAESGRFGPAGSHSYRVRLRWILRDGGGKSAAARAGTQRCDVARNEIRFAARRSGTVLPIDRTAPHEAQRLHGFLRADVAAPDARAGHDSSVPARVVSGESALRN